MNFNYPDYENSLTNLSCSILSYFNVENIKHNTLCDVDYLLDDIKPRNVVYMVFDALGSVILDKHLGKNSFLHRQYFTSISSTFPPTTVAATTAINTGLTPLETGWLGWYTYFKEVDHNVVTFFNTLQGTDKQPAAPYSLAWKNIPYKSLSMQIKEAAPDVRCTAVTPFLINDTDETIISSSLDETCKTIEKLTKEDGRHFIYSYYPQPDSSMHDLGVDDIEITKIVKDINAKLLKLEKKLDNDTLVIVTADHGHINSKWFFLCDYPDLNKLLIRPHSMENRAASLFVIPDKKEEFKTLFYKHFGNHFLLMEHDEFINSNLLGYGEKKPNIEDFVGDFVAISTDEYSLGETYEDAKMVGIHAGLTLEELAVPLIIF